MYASFKPIPVIDYKTLKQILSILLIVQFLFCLCGKRHINSPVIFFGFMV
jgi:hypothetical protein